METNNENEWREFETKQKRGRIMGGLLVASIGSLFLAREMGAVLPAWLFTWKMFLIGLGLVLAVKHKFRHPGWIILMGIGGIFLLNDFSPDMNITPFIWPLALIMIGLAIAFKPRRHNRMKKQWGMWHQKRYGRYEKCGPGSSADVPGSSEDEIESTAIMAGVKKNIISKNFKGGEITNVLGGSEINLLQADLAPDAKLEVTQVIGGTTLIIPANWEIRSEMTTIMGGVEDKRPVMHGLGSETKKLLILTGTTVMGGIEIKSI